MTEQELIELVETKFPDELTSSELAGLQYALLHSPELRQALSERLELEQYLHAALGGHQVSAEEIMASSASAAARRARGRRIRWSLGLGIAGLAIGLILWTKGYRPRGWQAPDAQIAAVAPLDEKQAADAKGAAGDKASADKAAEDKASQLSADAKAIAAAGPKATPAPGENPAAQPPVTQVAVAPPAQAAPPAPPAAPAPPPRTPWTPLSAIIGEPAPDDSLLVEDLTPNTPAPSEQDLRKWFAEVPGQPHNFGSQNHFNIQCGVVSGLVRLQSPWAPEAALRMTLGDFHRLRIHLWNENEGVTLQFLYTRGRAWLAYRATRKPGQPMPESLFLIGDDEGRNLRLNANAIDISTVDLRCDGKTITLSRRDVPILSVPFAGMPKEVYFEGKAIVRQLQLVRASDASVSSAPPRPVVLDMKEPAKGQWITDLGEGAALNQLPDGRAELSLEKIGKAVWAALPLANDRIQEVILELDDPQPGSGVFLGDATGKSLGGLGFFREQRTGRTAVAQGNPNEHRSEMTIDPNDAIQSYCAPKTWVKMLVGCGVNRFWISEDGEHWARACDPWVAQRAVIGSVGMYCVPGPQPRSIRLRRLIVRELPALAAIVPIELRRQAPLSAVDLVASEWLIGACLSQPAGADAKQWRRACALRTLAANSTVSSAPAVLDSLVADLMSDADRPWREQLQLLDETSELRNCWEDPGLARRCEQLYARVGQQTVAAGHPEAFAKALQAQLMAPLWSRQEPAQGIEDVDRQQLVEFVYEHNWPQALALAGDLRLTRRLTPDQTAILDWAEAIAPRNAISRHADKALLKPEWRHPVVVELSKEAYNVLAELEAALEGKAYRDACQIISTAGNQGSGPGLLPDSHDADLLLSFPNAVRKAMREHPALAAAMNEQFGASGRVRVRQAIADEDAVSVEAATLQFCGTQAAAEAHRWLGDRAVASGAFAQAIAHYDECLKTASPDTRAKAVAGSRLAAAMIGRPAPDSAVVAADFGDVKLSAAEFKQLLDDLRKSRSTSATGALTTAAAAPAAAPPASGFTSQPRGRFDGDMGENPQNVPGEMPQLGVDWVARQCSVVPAGDLLIVSNRFQVSAFNVKSNQYVWRAMLGGEQGPTHEWSLTPMRPLVTMQRVFARRLTKQGPLLAALDLADGKVLWTTRPEPEKFILSDPAFIQDQLFVLVASRVDQEYLLSLASYDPASGAAVSLRPLARLREAWWWQQRSCQVTPLEDSLLVACAGCVLRVDIAGQIGWLRRVTWLPASLDRGANMQDSTPPIVAGDRLFVSQPGVREIQCLAPESGRLIWQTPMPTLRRVVGLAGDRLIVQTDAGFSALSAADGKLLWEHAIPTIPVGWPPLPGLLDGQLLSGANMLLAVKAAPVGDDRNYTPTLLWIDLSSGRESSLFGIDALRHERPRLGPLAMVDGRLFALSGHDQEPHRDILELTAQGPAWSGSNEKQAELSPWRTMIDPALSEAVAETFPKWILLGGPTDKKHPLRVAEWQGETQILEVQAASGRPFSLVRRGQVPSGTPKLVARVASDAKWKLEITAGEKTITSQELTRESTGGAWKTIELSLEPVAGQTVWLVVRQIDVDGSQPMVKWKTLEIRD